jgi:hypothetical protein
LPEPLTVASALPLLTPGKKRNKPWRAVGVSTAASKLCFCKPVCPSNNAKKNVLLRTIGPPTLAVY